MNKEITLNIDESSIANMKSQKRMLLMLSESKLIPDSVKKELDGILCYFDEIQDKCVKEGFDENAVFDLSSNHPEGEKEYSIEFKHGVEKLDRKIAENYKEKFY